MSDSQRKLEMPDRRKNTYESLEKHLNERLDQHVEEVQEDFDDYVVGISNRLRRFFIKALAIFAVLGLTSAGALAGFGYLLKQVQQQRYDSNLRSCLEQNERHDSAIEKSNTELPTAYQETVRLLVDELQPYRVDCKGYARSRVKGPR